MTFIDQVTKELHIKIVYYGPPYSGKTTNLVKLHEALKTEVTTGNLVSLATNSDKALFFDFLPANPKTFRGYMVRFQCCTVPGPVGHNSSRQWVLEGVDGVVFVADSREERMSENVESFEDLQENLRSLKLNLDSICCVLQYNKRDLPNVAGVERMEALLGNRPVKRPTFLGIATKGEGVLEAFKDLERMLLEKLTGGDDAAAAALVVK
ncbi:MAG: GTPase domain-containing protein [Verrucomicrobiota bacterium]